MPRLPIPSDTEAFPRGDARCRAPHPPDAQEYTRPSSYLAYTGQAGALLSTLSTTCAPHIADRSGDGAGALPRGAGGQCRFHLERARLAGPAGRRSRGGAPRR